MKDRLRPLNDAPFRPGGAYVLYWAQMNRRASANHALVHACGVANELSLPVLYYEGLTCDYEYASDRLHTFIIEGVQETAARLDRLGIGYCFYLRRRRSDPNDVLYRLAARAALVVTDDYPGLLAADHGVAMHAVDSSCVVPMRKLAEREYAAYTIRPKIHRLLDQYLVPALRTNVAVRWSEPAPKWHTAVTASNLASLVASCEIDHGVAPSRHCRGGRAAAMRTLRRFLDHRLLRYASERNQPTAHVTSGLSPYLHFGHISSLEIALKVGDRAPEFLEELIVRRELAFNFACTVLQPACLDDLPAWALQTLRRHTADPRAYLYSREQFEQALTHDPLWNACQRELLLRGSIHGYYRMYWGKKIVEWSATPDEALETMIGLNDRYALDGRDPNSYTSILWCFGLHDRPWAERPIFGLVRYMSYEGMRRKTNVDAYLREIAELA